VTWAGTEVPGAGAAGKISVVAFPVILAPSWWVMESPLHFVYLQKIAGLISMLPWEDLPPILQPLTMSWKAVPKRVKFF
jgi:hypothetical protein